MPRNEGEGLGRVAGCVWMGELNTRRGLDARPRIWLGHIYSVTYLVFYKVSISRPSAFVPAPAPIVHNPAVRCGATPATLFVAS